VIVARPGIGAETLLPNASVEVTAADVGLQTPVIIEVPKGEAPGSVAPGEGCGGSIAVGPTALLASKVVLGVAAAIPVAGHVVIAPIVPPDVGAKAPRLS